METTALSVEQQIKQLGDARKLVLSDSSYYPQIIQGILPIVAPAARVELRRWVSDFLAETFASPTIPPQQKETLSLIVLETLKNLIENQQEDPTVVKSVVQTATSIYPHVFRWIINNAYDIPTWERMLAIKSRILRIWETSTPGVRVCCIKFAQRVVLVQTKGPDANAKHGDPEEVSLTVISPNNAVLDPKNLEAEASGLLDRVLSVFQDNTCDAVPVNATLNSLSTLIRARPQLSNKILNVILNFNPLKEATSNMTPRTRVAIKSMEKTTRQLLIHIIKRDQRHPLIGRIHQYLDRIIKAKSEIFDDATRKRSPPGPTDVAESTKRSKPVAPTKPPARVLQVPPLKPGAHSVADLYTITTDASLKVFDVAILPEDLVVNIGITILQRIDTELLNQAVEGIRQRLKSLCATSASKTEVPIVQSSVPYADEDDDDYEPDLFSTEEPEQKVKSPDAESSKFQKPEVTEVALGTFYLPTPPPLSHEEAAQVGHSTFSRVFGVMQTLDERGKKLKGGLNRLAASNYDRDAWITIITRLATRASANLEDNGGFKMDLNLRTFSLSNTIRETLYIYVLEDFRKRMDIAVTWLCEEWYNDKVQMKLSADAVAHYEKWTIRILDGFLPYLDGQDRGLVIKFLGDIPGVSKETLTRIKGLCRDPATVNMALQSLLFLVAFKPPIRELVLDVIEDIWNTYEDTRPIVVKLFAKWRPGLGTSFTDGFKEERNVETSEIAAVPV